MKLKRVKRQNLPKRYERELINIVLDHFSKQASDNSNMLYGIRFSEEIRDRIRYVARIMVEGDFLFRHSREIDALIDNKVDDILGKFWQDWHEHRKTADAKVG